MERLRDRMRQELRIRGKADRTVEAYVDNMRVMTERTGLVPGRVTERDIKAYLEDLREVRQVAPSTFVQHVAAMRFFYTYVLPRDFPILREAKARQRRVLPDILSLPEVQAVLHALHRPWLFALCATLYGCGLRRAEGLAVATEDIDRGRALLHVRDGKGGSDRFVPIPSRLQAILDAHVCGQRIGAGPLFVSRLLPGRTVSPDTLGRALAAAAVEAGVRKRVTPHSLRHAYATHLLERGVSLRLIQQFLGHRRIETTTRYTHLTDGSLDRVQQVLALMTAAL